MRKAGCGMVVGSKITLRAYCQAPSSDGTVRFRAPPTKGAYCELHNICFIISGLSFYYVLAS